MLHSEGPVSMQKRSTSVVVDPCSGERRRFLEVSNVSLSFVLRETVVSKMTYGDFGENHFGDFQLCRSRRLTHRSHRETSP